MRKSRYLVGAFLATALLIGGCSDSEEIENPAQNQTQNLAGQRLTDDNGVEYTLIDNGDGTETARYDDGRSVTFRRQEDGSLDYLAGAAGLIAGMAAGYYLFHGFSNTGTWDSARNRYTVSEPLKRRDNKNNSSVIPATTANNSNANSKVNLSKENSSVKPATTNSSSSAKSGFGSAGARGSSSAAS